MQRESTRDDLRVRWGCLARRAPKMPGYQLPSGAHGLVMRALDSEEGHMPEKKEMSIADLLRRERAQKLSLIHI